MKNKVAIITGSRRGIGEAIAYKLAENGWNIVINDREEESKVNSVVNNIKKKYGVDAFGIMADVSEESDVKRLLEEVNNHFGKIDLLVNNAAIVEDIAIEDKTTEIFNETIRNNITSTYLMSKFIGRQMFNNKKGKIINISSTNGTVVFCPDSIDYDATKAAVISLTHNFALEYAPYVLVNSIAPGWVNTDMNKELPREFVEGETEKIYLKRFAEPEEIANLVNFLASEECTYINGEVIKIDGGY